MSENSSDLYFCEKPLLPVPVKAVYIHEQIVKNLKLIESTSYSSCFDRRFRRTFTDTLQLFNSYQQAILENSNMTPSCRKGCTSCCFHWVEDVNSFEAEIIADHIRSKMPGMVQKIIDQCAADEAELERLAVIVSAKKNSDVESEKIDETDLLLSVFYQMRHPCPFLNEDKSCAIYSIRPITCRIYISFSDITKCDPEYINDSDIPTYLLNLEEEASAILDRIHFKFQKFEGDTGLRSLVCKYLKN
jgi:Fe-S-cluster containining protein